MRSESETGVPGGMATETYSFPVVIVGGGFAGTAGLHDAAEGVTEEIRL
jgi:hypothetical protein